MKKDVFEKLQNMTADMHDEQRCPFCKMSAKLLTEFVEEVCDGQEQQHKAEMREAIEEALLIRPATLARAEEILPELFKKYGVE